MSISFFAITWPELGPSEASFSRSLQSRENLLRKFWPTVRPPVQTNAPRIEAFARQMPDPAYQVEMIAKQSSDPSAIPKNGIDYNKSRELSLPN